MQANPKGKKKKKKVLVLVYLSWLGIMLVEPHEDNSLVKSSWNEIEDNTFKKSSFHCIL